jgi:hypothetical protein
MTHGIKDTISQLLTRSESLPHRKCDLAAYDDGDIKGLEAMRDLFMGIAAKYHEIRPAMEMTGKAWSRRLGNAKIQAERNRN